MKQQFIRTGGFTGRADYYLKVIRGENKRLLKEYMLDKVHVILHSCHCAEFDALDTELETQQMIQKLSAPPNVSSKASEYNMAAHGDASAVVKGIICISRGPSGFRFILKNEIVYFLYPGCTFSANHGVNSSILSNAKHQSFNFCATSRQIIVLDFVPIPGRKVLYNANTVRSLVHWFKTTLS